jgi:hypothetical protein
VGAAGRKCEGAAVWPQGDRCVPGTHDEPSAQHPEALPVGVAVRVLAVAARLEDEQQAGSQTKDGMRARGKGSADLHGSSIFLTSRQTNN